MDDTIREGTVCFIKQNNKLLLAHIEYGPKDRKWTGIGGFIEPHEEKINALMREYKEETYIQLDPTRITQVALLKSSYILHVFMTDFFSGVIKAKDPTIKDLLWFPIHDLHYPFMHPGSEKWLPPVLEGKYVTVTDGIVREVSSFSSYNS